MWDTVLWSSIFTTFICGQPGIFLLGTQKNEISFSSHTHRILIGSLFDNKSVFLFSYLCTEKNLVGEIFVINFIFSQYRLKENVMNLWNGRKTWSNVFINYNLITQYSVQCVITYCLPGRQSWYEFEARPAFLLFCAQFTKVAAMKGCQKKRQKMIQALNEDLQSENTGSLYYNIIIIKLNWFPDKMGKYRTQEKTSTFISLVKSAPDEQT